jgi:hypothetical protein
MLGEAWLCDRMRHEYVYVDAEGDVYRAVRSLLKFLPGFTASYVQWLAEYGVDLS